MANASYTTLSGRVFSARAAALKKILKKCRLCPRKCGVDRLSGASGFCKAPPGVSVSSCNLHFGEEPPISGTRGSGTIFFTCCSLGCVFCQNYPISHLGNGNPVTVEELADMMLGLQKRGAHNINLVTPTHVVPSIVEALVLARRGGLSVPLVYNSSGYDSVEVLKLLDGIVDIYLPDAKYHSPALAAEYSRADDYPAANLPALEEMFRQVGNLETDQEGAALRGLLIRHLVLPGSPQDSAAVLRDIAQKLSNTVSVSLMSQYHPAYRSPEHPLLSRPVRAEEYQAVLDAADAQGFTHGYRQLEER